MIDLFSSIHYVTKYYPHFNFKNQNKITVIHPHRSFVDSQLKKSSAIFLDLTHFRHSIAKDGEQFIDFRHDLEENIRMIYKSLPKGGLILGNMLEDDYVKAVLNRLSEKDSINFSSTNNFWHLIK